MSRTTRNGQDRWLRTPPATQQERRQYYAALDQEIPVRVRAKRRPNNLPDSWTELRSSGHRQLTHVDSWLWKQLGKTWSRIFKAGISLPTRKTGALNRKNLLDAVFTHTYVSNGNLWGILPNGCHVQSPQGFLVHPVTARLIYGCKYKSSTVRHEAPPQRFLGVIGLVTEADLLMEGIPRKRRW